MFNDPVGIGAVRRPWPQSKLVPPIRPGFVVAIPVKDEEERLPACLRALALQLDRLGRPIPPTLIRVVVFANNCTDRSASLARKLGGDLPLDVRVVEARLAPATAHAGAARRAAMDIAEAWLVAGGEWDGVILTTDADSQVAPDWIAENLASFRVGAEAVLGRIDLDGEGELLPDALHRRGELEDAYESLLTELCWLLDPLEHNPWPHHATISGASLGITRSAYCRVRAASSRPSGRGQSAGCIAFAPGCEDSLLPDCLRDHVGSDKWARAGWCGRHLAHTKPGAGSVLRRRLGAVPHGVRPRLMAGEVAPTACRGTPCSRSRLVAKT